MRKVHGMMDKFGKTIYNFKNDRLLVSQKLNPVLRRLTSTLISLIYVDILFLILI